LSRRPFSSSARPADNRSDATSRSVSRSARFTGSPSRLRSSRWARGASGRP